MYSKRKDLEARIAKTTAGLDKALQNVAQRKRRVKAHAPKVTLTTDRWYHQYYWFRTGNGLLAVCGKNASQNEEIVKRRLEKHDLYFHSEAPGSGSCVLKNPDQQTVTPSDQEEVGQFVVCMSRTWKAGVSDRAYWVLPNQVSKTTETGEYVTTGAFIVRGKRNYTSLCNLELGASTEGGELMIAPYRRILKMNNPVRAKIIPGKNRRNQVLGKLVDLLNLQSGDKTLLDQCLPTGIHLV
jgi:predicted ribosome quality control (RQC) complex YloA/Tae2 family protein